MHPERDAFGPHDRQLLETIAERAAMALYNGMLFDRTRSHAFTDPLTGLYNLRYLTQYVEDRCSRESEALIDPDTGAPDTGAIKQDRATSGSNWNAGFRKADFFALLCLDLDSFKPINDNFGHQKCDEVLRDLSALL